VTKNYSVGQKKRETQNACHARAVYSTEKKKNIRHASTTLGLQQECSHQKILLRGKPCAEK
jgi:hypothetical protein